MSNNKNTIDSTEITPVDMNKVNYMLSRPAKLLAMLPEDDKERLSGHVGRRFSPGARVGRHQKR